MTNGRMDFFSLCRVQIGALFIVLSIESYCLIHSHYCMQEDNIGLLVFDFDWSLINENSDTWVIQQCTPHIYDEIKALRAEMQWTKLMDHAVGVMMRQHGVTIRDISAALQRIPIFDEILEIIKRCEQLGVDLAIISDANTFYIDEILNHLSIRHCFKYIVTNGACVDDEVLRIRPHQCDTMPHNCPHCPINLCKGAALDAIVKEYVGRRIVYVGDGGGDFCPSLRLTAQDTVCCRENWTLHKMIQKHSADVMAMVKPWNNGRELYNVIFAPHTCA